MFFFMTYYLVRFFFGGTYWILSKSASGIYYLIKQNQTKHKEKVENIKKILDSKDITNVKNIKKYDTLLLTNK